MLPPEPPALAQAAALPTVLCVQPPAQPAALHANAPGGIRDLRIPKYPEMLVTACVSAYFRTCISVEKDVTLGDFGV